MKLDAQFLQETAKLTKKMEQMGKTFESGELSAIMEKASLPLITDAQRRVNVVTGNLRNAIGFVKRKKSNNVVIVGVRNYGAWNAKGYHAHLLEYGTRPNRKTKGKGRYRAGAKRGGLNPGQFAFMHPAYEANRSTMQTTIFAGVRKLLENKIK
ncbi:MAG: HK97 gp10 family phage protein [Ilumatobacteraceae bacterium]